MRTFRIWALEVPAMGLIPLMACVAMWPEILPYNDACSPTYDPHGIFQAFNLGNHSCAEQLTMMSLRTGFLWTALVAFPIAGVILLSMFLWDKFHDGQVEKLQVAGAVSTPQNAEVQPSSAKSVVPTNAQLALTAKPVEPNTDAIHTGVEDEVRFVDGRLTWPQMKTPADAITVPDLTSSEPSPRRAIKSRVGAIWPLWR